MNEREYDEILERKLMGTINEMTDTELRRVVREKLGIKASHITLSQSNIADKSRQWWTVYVEGTGRVFQVSQHVCGSYDTKAWAEVKARRATYEELAMEVLKKENYEKRKNKSSVR